MSKQGSGPEVAHTPGPWRNAGLVGSGIWIKASKQIAVVYGPRINASAEANARLIAAAPDLLAACEAILAALNSGDVAIGRLDPIEDEEPRLRAAVAKARGT